MPSFSTFASADSLEWQVRDQAPGNSWAVEARMGGSSVVLLGLEREQLRALYRLLQLEFEAPDAPESDDEGTRADAASATLAALSREQDPYWQRVEREGLSDGSVPF